RRQFGLRLHCVFFQGVASLVKTRGLPVFFEGVAQSAHDLRIMYDDSDFAPRIQLRLPQALAADKSLAPVPDNRSRMQTHAGEWCNRQGAPAGDASDNLDVQAPLGLVPQQLQDLLVGDLRIVDQQLFPGLLDKSRELFAGIRGTNDESVETGGISLPVEIR